MRAKTVSTIALLLSLCLLPTAIFAGPYGDPGIHADDAAFVGWATGYENYSFAAEVLPVWQTPDKALGEPGGVFDVVTLGDRPDGDSGAPGEITLTFDIPIVNDAGPDFAVFENGLGSTEALFGELGYVEVSSDGETFVRFPSASLIDDFVPQYGTFDATLVYNLAGSRTAFQGTLFDLEDLVTYGLADDIDLAAITHVRIIDIPGSGAYTDQGALLGLDGDHPIYDPWPTIESGGFDLDAIGVLHTTATAFDDDDDTTDDDDVVSDDDDEANDDDDVAPWQQDDDDAAGTDDDDQNGNTETASGDDDDDDGGCGA